MTRTDLVLPVDKPEGPTSHDVVAMVRRALGVRRVGHTGTLDPFASGLMLICVGKATRLAEYLSGMDKGYDAVARLGVATDTEDREGEVLEERDGWRDVSEVDIEEAMTALRGTIDQVPPRFSAKKVQGERSYRLARRGEHVELEPRSVTVHELTLGAYDPPDLRFTVRCSSGTYVRSIARDLGEALSVGAHLTGLRRTSIGAFSVDDAVPVGVLDEPDTWSGAAIAPLDAVGHLARVAVVEEEAARLAHGQSVTFDADIATGLVAVERDGELLAIARSDGRTVKPRKVFAS